MPTKSIAHDVMKEMLSRLDYIVLKPELILAVESDELQQRYPEAKIVDSVSEEYSVDLIIANLVQNNLETEIQAWRRLLKPNGLLMFSTFGVEMHDIGDALLRAGFSDPVMDVEPITFNAQLYEVIYGHAWGAMPVGYTADEAGIVKIPITSLKKQ